MSGPFANVLQPLINIAIEALRWFHDSLGISWGFSIILLTVVVRAGLIPLTYKQLKGMAQMQEHQPAMKELMEKYKDDPQRKQQEIMKFYKENKINPLSSCLPLLLQIPFFIALFYALRESGLQADMRATGDHFLFIDSLVEKPRGIDLAVLLTLYVGSQLGSSLVTMTPAMDPNHRKLMLAMPFMFVFFILNFPAGLLVYWITTNFWTFGQAFVIRRMRHKREALVALNGAVSVEPGEVAAITAKAPPPPPRKKRKRSGRRR